MEYQSTNLVAFLYKWRKPLIALPLLAGIVAAVFSAPYFIPPRYSSSVIVFPGTTNSISKALLPQTGFSDQDVMEFGAEEEAEQLLQILNSDRIRDSIVTLFNLMEHYDIDPQEQYSRTKLRETFEENVNFSRTRFMSVEIAVLDEDPQMAADIANAVSKLLDHVKREVQRERAYVALQIVKESYQDIRARSQELKDELRELRLKGIHDYESQSAVYAEQLGIAIVNSDGQNTASVQALQSRLDTLAKYGGQYVDIRDELKLLKEEEVKIRTKYDQAEVDYTKNLPTTFKVNNAYPAEKKSYPIRSLIVLISMLGTFIAVLVVILIVTAIRDERKRIKE